MIMKAPLLSEVFPEVAEEIRRTLRGLECEEFRVLIPEVDQLRIVDRCHCGDDTCASMYFVSSSNEEKWLADAECIETEGALVQVFSILENRIVEAEIIFQPQIRARLIQLFPD